MQRHALFSGPHFAALVALLTLLCTAPHCARATGVEGVWVQLGVPIRLGTPLLWDSAERRLVAIGDEAWAGADSIRDAWEFREASGWRRITLPGPPAGLDPGWQGLVPDVARRRFLTIRSDPPLHETGRLWALELGPPARWIELDATPGPPGGAMILDPRGESVWVRCQPYSAPAEELWMRSLADTGQWRMVRYVPSRPIWDFATWVDPERARLYSYGRRADLPDSVAACSLPLEGADDWTLEPGPVPRELSYYPLLSMPDEVRDRQVFLEQGWDVPATAWAFQPGEFPRWVPLGTVGADLSSAALGCGDDTLWAQGTSHPRIAIDARTLAIPLADPGAARVVANPVWPPFVDHQAFFHDPADSRWLYAGGFTGWWPGRMPLDSLWELRLDGERVTWRQLAIQGTPPQPIYPSAWVNDESARALYLLNGWDDGQHVPGLPSELWALRYDGTPRWTLLRSGGSSPVLRDRPVFAFDSARRRLVCFGYTRPGYNAPDANEVWTLAVDSLGDWTKQAAEGTPPFLPNASSAVFDAVRERVLFSAPYPSTTAFGALELQPRLR